ncbi:MAG: dethiobiotin synthase, partial [Gemmatimonadota bacterium]|nr:dethiobiotin synthase [Gemmatimonadota bacterium]
MTALKGFFITGTDTGVGKTAVAAALAWLMNSRGIKAAPVKPVQTGVAPGERGDLELCVEAAGITPTAQELGFMNPYRFRPAASPHLAAEEEGVEIDCSRILEAARRLAGSYDALVIEGAGGLLVPLTRKSTTLELAAEFGLPMVVVARAGLGTINHSLLTLEAAKRAQLTVAAVVLNRPEDEKPSEYSIKLDADNRKIIGELGGVPVFEALPHIA